jgi:hypothetical protein
MNDVTECLFIKTFFSVLEIQNSKPFRQITIREQIV